MRQLLRVLASSAILSICLAANLAAAADVASLLREGGRKSQAGDFAGAEASFAAAIAAAPEDGRGHVLRGYALGQLRRYQEAVDSLQRAQALGIAQPRLLFELGRAAVESGQWRIAADALEAYEARRPGLGVVALLRGRAELGRGDLAAAEDHLNEAIRRDRRHANEAGVQLARVAAARGDTAAATDRLAEVRAELDSALRRAPGPRSADRAPGKPWSVSVSAGAGYNDNVIGLGDSQPLPGDISRQDAGILQQQAQASYGFRIDPSSTLNVSYGLAAVENLGLSRFNQVDNQITADYARRLTDRVGVALRVGGGHLLVGGDSFRSQIGGRLSAAYRWSDSSITEIAYAYARNDFHIDPVVAAFDRDGHSHGIALSQVFALPDSGARVLLGIGLGRNQTSGSDFESTGGSLLGAFSVPIPLRIAGIELVPVAQVSATFAVEDFDNPSVLTAATPGGAFARQDRVARITGAVTVPLRQGLDLYIGHAFTHNGSNIAVFDYDQHVVSGGLTVRF